jgi:hypothetical protein
VKAPKTWTAATEISSSLSFNKVAYGNGVFVASGGASGNSSAGYAYWSSDGVTWTKAVDNESDAVAAFDKSNMHVAFCNNVFIAVGGSSNNVNWAKSTDGKTWTAIGNTTASQADSNFNAKGSAYGNGYYVISGSGGRIAYATDPGSTWTIVANDADGTNFGGSSSTAFINAIAYGNGKYVAGGGGGTSVYTSVPSTTWTSADATKTVFDAGFINSLVFAGGRFVAVGGSDDGPGKAAYSTNGIDWTQSGDIKIGTDTKINGIAYGGDVFVSVDNKGNASYSTDSGIKWTLIADTKFEGSAINGVGYGNGKFVMVGADGKIAYSTPE